jgi:hypothetical protein
MTCDEARELFSARADDVITRDEVARLDTHLSGCAECRAEWARFERTVALVRGVEPARAPAGFVDRVLAATDPAPWPLRLVRQVFMPLRIKLPLEAAAVMLVAGLAVMTFQHSPEMQRVARQELERPAAPEPRAQPPVPAPPSDAPAVAFRDAPAPSPPAPPHASPEEARPKQSDERVADSVARSDAAPPPPPVSAPEPTPAPRSALAPQPAAPAPSTVAQAPQRNAIESVRRESAAKSAAAPLAAGARPTPDVTARLTVANRADAVMSLANIVQRLGGSERARRTETGASYVDLVIPRSAYEGFTREVSQLGSFTSEQHTSDLPTSVSVTVRVAD